MKLYHASAVIVKQPNLCYAREHLDFGKGFYLTSLYEQAQNYAMRFLLRHSQAYINTYLLDEGLDDYKWKIFEQYDEEWLDYVSKCRKGMQDTDFDIVEGGIANDKVFNTIDLYFSGLMNKADALGRLAFERPNHQLCILNQEIITRHLHFVNAEEITWKGGKDAC